ncbi:hypothetical protein [Acetivibrio straminisolvens]|jgi:hypothetical protein|uniref:DUF4878 domain-containing protein n=1 Tax=Acetivibrio straminisolvens JCM 21531 TaxID=1294263 RepID=W4V942_9FIRM|nr:hypothetical protein [Acetivibrio straminisolvens]GAE89905.1 hypothetical protein JCM21531_3475 [Acetivibrio straminisolvens JCM 21531]
MKAKKVIASLLILGIFLCSFMTVTPVFAQDNNLPESVVYSMYDARNNNNFNQFISSFYLADMLPENDIETLKQTFYNERIEFTIEPLEHIYGSRVAEFTYIEIVKIRNNSNRFAISTNKITASLVKIDSEWKILMLDYIESYPFSIPQDIVTTFYNARNNKDFDTYINCFYYADLLSESDLESFRFPYFVDSSYTYESEIEPISLSVTDSNNVEFKYYELQTITTDKTKLLRKTEFTAYLKKKNNEWKIEYFDLGSDEITILERY